MPEHDWLVALEFGRVDEGHPSERWRMVSDTLGFLLDDELQHEIGFKIIEFSEWDLTAVDVEELWYGPRFHVPQLGLDSSSVGEIVLATRALYGELPSANRLYFSEAVSEKNRYQALRDWLTCLQTGDAMAHFGLGYTLYDLGRFHEAYRHLRYYTEISPVNHWAWMWLGRAAQAIGEFGEALAAYERAIALDDDGDSEASDLLRALRAERSG